MPLDIARIRRERPQTSVHYFASIGSTMTEASRLAASGAAHGTLVLAEEQTGGMGRLGRQWISPPQVGIYASVILRLNLPPANLPIASLLLGLATVEAIHGSTKLACDLRWPNDVLIRERKVAGILTHFVENAIVAGIGINVNQESLPANVRTPATSLAIESGAVQCRETILLALLHSIDSFCAMLHSEGPPAILRAFTAASSYTRNRQVVVEESGTRGMTMGLDEHGFLLLRSESGRIERLAAGGVRPDVRRR